LEVRLEANELPDGLHSNSPGNWTRSH